MSLFPPPTVPRSTITPQFVEADVGGRLNVIGHAPNKVGPGKALCEWVRTNPFWAS
jgi:hypothetical protein